jgi:hypothetical protein
MIKRRDMVFYLVRIFQKLIRVIGRKENFMERASLQMILPE